MRAADLPLIGDWLRRRAADRIRVGALATALLDEDAGAYHEARDRARRLRAQGDAVGDQTWSRVAVEIARRTSKVIGERTADRYTARR